MKTRIDLIGTSYIEIEIFHTGEGQILSEGLRCGDDYYKMDEYNVAIDGMESLILGLACAGVDVSTPQFRDGIISALDAIANNY
jgi:hypothetical protein